MTPDDRMAQLEAENQRLREQNTALLAALHTVFAGQPFYPAAAWPGTTPVQTR
jgi:hypothetical protein